MSSNYILNYSGQQINEKLAEIDNTDVLSISEGGTGETNTLSAITALGGHSILDLGKSLLDDCNNNPTLNEEYVYNDTTYTYKIDLNDYINPGTYYSAARGVTEQIKNSPVQGYAYKLIVMQGPYRNTRMQIVYIAYNGIIAWIYFRSGMVTNETRSWTSWKKIMGNPNNSENIYLEGLTSSSTTNKTQIIFRYNNDEKIALSANTSGVFCINSSSSDSTGGLIFKPNGNNFIKSGSLIINNSSATSGYNFEVNGKSLFQDDIILQGKISNGTYDYTLPSAAGTLALTSNIPTNISSFTNDSGYLTSHQDISGKMNLTPTVASTSEQAQQLPGQFYRVNNKIYLKTGSSLENIQLTTYEDKTTTLSSSSTDNQYPSAKCVYDMIGNIETLLSQV